MRKAPKRRTRLRCLPLLAVVLTAALSSACGKRETTDELRPLVVIGFDGGEWSVVRALWDQGKLPHLKALADRGAAGRLETKYGSSPIIWTTIATGHEREVHGITGFVVPTDRGDVPISSSLRRVPAVWNLLTLLEKKVSVLGWYATWPAESINGLMVTDHVMREALDERVSPPGRLGEIDALLATVQQLPDEETYPFGVALSDRRSERDLLIERLAPTVAAERNDLLLVYFRVIDHLSHFYWKFWQPADYADVDPGEVAEKGNWIPAGYERLDRAIGDIVQAVPDANFLVISDHGFESGRETRRIYLDIDVLLHHLGYLEWNSNGVDMGRTKAFAWGSSTHANEKSIRLAVEGLVPDSRVAETERNTLLARLRSDLEEARYESGLPVFRLGKPGSDHPSDLRVRVLRKGATQTISVNGKAYDDVITNIESISGTHKPGTAGVFLAAGPDIDPEAPLDGISIFDVTPTLLYGLGLPVAEDFAGRAWTVLFTEDFRKAHPLRTIDSWKMTREGELRESEADAEIIEELKALGYLE